MLGLSTAFDNAHAKLVLSLTILIVGLFFGWSSASAAPVSQPLWRTATTVGTLNSVSTGHWKGDPDAAIDSAGRQIVDWERWRYPVGAWTDGLVDTFTATRPSGSEWTSSQLNSAEIRACNGSSLASGVSGDAFLLRLERVADGCQAMLVRLDSAGVWRDIASPPLPKNTVPKLVAIGDGSVALVWTKPGADSSHEIVASTNIEGSFNEPEVIGTTTTSGARTVVAAGNSSGDLSVAWLSETGASSSTQILARVVTLERGEVQSAAASYETGWSTWTARAAIQLTLDSSGTTHLVFTTLTTSPARRALNYARRSSDEDFDVSEPIATLSFYGQETPIVAAEAGTVSVVWTQEELLGFGAVRGVVTEVHRTQDGTFSEPTGVRAASGGSSSTMSDGWNPAVVVDEVGNSVVAWTSSTSVCDSPSCVTTSLVGPVYSAFRPRGGAFSNPVLINASAIDQTKGAADNPSLAVRAGRVLLAWDEWHNEGNTRVLAVRAAEAAYEPGTAPFPTTPTTPTDPLPPCPGAAHCAGVEPLFCPKVKLLGVRGSGERTGFGSIVGGFASRLEKRMLSRFSNQIDVFARLPVSYQAIEADQGANFDFSAGKTRYRESVDSGVAAVTSVMSNDPCLSVSQYVFAGYSQGAHVIGDYLSKHASSSVRSRIRAVVLFGDPKFNPKAREVIKLGGFNPDLDGVRNRRRSGALREYKGRVFSYCKRHDIVCQWRSADFVRGREKSRGIRVHSSYGSKEFTSAVDRVARLVT